MTAPGGDGDFKIASAYVEVHLRDETKADEQKIRDEIEGQDPAKLRVGLDDRSVEETKAKAKTEADVIGKESPIKLPVEIDQRSFAKAEAQVKSLSSASSGGGAGMGMGGLIAAAGVLGSSVVGGVSLAAIPAVFAAIGIAAEHSNAQVSAAFTVMKASAMQALQQGFEPMVPALVGIENQAAVTVTGLEPVFAQAAKSMDPLITKIGTDLIKATDQGVRASIPILASLGPVADAIGGDFVKVEQGIGGFLSHLNVSVAAQGLSLLGDDLRSLLPDAGALLNEIMPLGNAFLSVLGPAIHDTTTALSVLSPVINFVSGGIEGLSPELGVVVPALAAMAAVAKLTTGSWTDFSGALKFFKGDASAAGGALDHLAAKVGITTAATKAGNVATAEATATRARMQAAADAQAVSELAAASAAGGDAKAQLELAVAQDEAAASARAAAVADSELAVAGEASMFAMGPLGIVLGVVGAALALFVGNASSASSSANKMTGDLDKLEQAASNTQALSHLFQTDPNAESQLALLQRYGVTLGDLAAANNGNAAAQEKVAAAAKQAKDALDTKVAADKAELDAVTKQNTVVTEGGVTYEVNKGAIDKATAALNTDKAAQGSATAIYNQASGAVKANAEAHAASASATKLSGAQQAAAAGEAQALGISLGSVTAGFQQVIAGGGTAAATVAGLTAAFAANALATAQAATAISQHFKQADQAVSQAQQSMDSANHSYAQSVRAVADAQHGVATAEQQVAQARQAIVDAESGVVVAENNVTKAQDAERQAQINLTAARQAAVEQLKALHLQLTDQVASEESARISLFDQQAAAAKLGITSVNAQAILNSPLTAANEAAHKAALALIQAQNSLNDTMNTGANLRTKVIEADKAGVNGSQQVTAAQTALRNAQDQVVSSERALEKAHQAVTQADQQLSSANYSLSKAHQAVTDAEYAERQASIQVQQARYNLTQAVAADSRTLDINTAAGQANQAMLQKLHGAIVKEFGPTQQGYTTLVNDTANAFGWTKQKAEDYLKQLGLIPKDFQFGVTAVAGVDLNNIQSAIGSFSKVIAESKHGSGGLRGFAGGGLVTGAGGPTEDNHLIAASSGEYVVNASAAKKHYALVEAINTDQIPRYAGGGLVGPALGMAADAMGGLGNAYQIGVDMRTIMGFPHPPGLPKYVPPPPTYGNVGGGSGPIPTGQHRSLIDGALMVDGIPRGAWPRWEAGMNTLIGRESGWNPNAINLWDSNAAAGHPSQGLTQTIPGTFESYRSRSLPDNIRDPMANIAASINYIRSRYGDISAVQQANPNLPPKGYDHGGPLMPGYTLAYNGKNKPENVLSSDQQMPSAEAIGRAVAEELIPVLQEMRPVTVDMSGYTGSLHEVATSAGRTVAAQLVGAIRG